MREELHPRNTIQRNAHRIKELHGKIDETLARRSISREAWKEWEQACKLFHQEYNALAFPGGYEEGLQKIQAGDSNAIENALAFLEVKPYFFRSQYIKTKLTRLLKHAVLSVQQEERLKNVLESESQHKNSKSR
jgi:hypothetical protein